MATIKDVAKESNTSVGTVSRYLNGYNIKQENRLKIEAAIKKLNFSLNTIARGLKTNKTYTIGIVIPELSNIFTNYIIDGMERFFDKHGYNILVCNSNNNVKKEIKKLNLLKNKMVDGILLMPVSNNSEHIKVIQKSGIPIVLIDRLITNLECDGVVADNINGSYQAVENIINKGHKKIGIIAGPNNIYTAKERLTGYKRALKDYNIEINENYISICDYKIHGGYTAFKKLYNLENPPTAIFVSNYFTTLGTVKAIVEEKLKIGEDISIFGYDQSEIFEILNPPLSIVMQPRDEIGSTAAELLLKRLNEDYSNFPTILRLKNELLVTDSVKNLIK